MKDKIKNIIITIEILSIFALLYFNCDIFLNSDGYRKNIFARAADLFGISVADSDNSVQTGEIYDITYPLSAAVRNNQALYGVQGNIEEVDRIYSKSGAALAQALESAHEFFDMTESEFEQRLSTQAVCFYFDGAVPLFVLGRCENTNLETDSIQNVSFVALSAHADGVDLICRASDGTLKYARTTVKSKSVTDLTGEFSAGNAAFAFESGADFEKLLPETPIMQEKPYLARAAVSIPELNFGGKTADELLDAFGYNLYTVKKYSEKDGTEVYVQDSMTMKIRSDGFASFAVYGKQRAAAADNSEKDREQTSTAVGTAKKIKTMVERIYQSFGADGLYVKNFEYDGKSGTGSIAFGCHMLGIPVRIGTENSIAEVNFSGENITSAYMYLKKYQPADGQTDALLPLKQLAALINGQSEYSDGYVGLCPAYDDNGASQIKADWFAERRKDTQSG